MMRVEEERFHPRGFAPPWIRYQHLERYRWAGQFVAGRQVLDAGCGMGYGSAQLAEAGASRVHGFDCCAEAVAFAARSYSRPNLSFAVAAADRLPVPDGSYDVYLSFETVEHVEDDLGLLAEAARVLRPGGLLHISTPNRELLDPGTSFEDKPFNRFHIREYCRGELAARLERHFGAMTWYGQSGYSSACVAWLGRVGRLWPALGAKLHQARKCLGWLRETSSGIHRSHAMKITCIWRY